VADFYWVAPGSGTKYVRKRITSNQHIEYITPLTNTQASGYSSYTERIGRINLCPPQKAHFAEIQYVYPAIIIVTGVAPPIAATRGQGMEVGELSCRCCLEGICDWVVLAGTLKDS